MSTAKRDSNYQVVLMGVSTADGVTPLSLTVDPTTKRLLFDVNGATLISDGDTVAAGNDGYIVLGSDGSNYQVVTTDSDGHLQVDVLSGGGAGTQYTEGDTDTTITGTAAMMEVASNVLQPIQGTVADGLLVNLGANNDVVVSATNLDIRDLTATDVVTANLSAIDNAVLDAIEVDTTTIAGAVTGTEMQVDVVSMPTVTVVSPPYNKTTLRSSSFKVFTISLATSRASPFNSFVTIFAE